MERSAASVPAALPRIRPFEALAGTFSAPGRTFERLLSRPTWWLPAVLWLLIAGASFTAVSSRIDWERTAQEAMEKQAEKRGGSVPPGAAERAVPMFKAIGTTFFGVIVVAHLFFVSLVLWGAARAFGGEVGYGGMLAVWAHANVGNMLAALVAIVVALQMPPSSLPAVAAERLVQSNLGAFLPETAGKPLVALATSFDLFSLFTLALLVAGFRRIPGLSRASATALPLVLWVVYVVLKSGLAMLRP